MDRQTDVLRVEGLRISFGSTEVVHGVSLQIAPRETLALVGESGCGKSVTALALARLLPGASICRVEGQIHLAGHDVMALSEAQLRRLRRDAIAYVFQDPASALHPSLTIGYQLTEALPGGRAARRARALECLAMAGLRDPELLLSAYPFTLSGGMQQRVVIAMALARSPGLLVADEPTTALDVTIQAQILDLLVDLQHRLGMSMLLITHNLGLVASTADRVSVMYAGHVVESGPVEDVLRRPAHPYTRGLLDVVPRLEGGMRRLEGIPGMVPPGGQQPEGCIFAPRCRHARPTCRVQRPDLLPAPELRPQQVACHFPLAGAGGGGP